MTGASLAPHRVDYPPIIDRPVIKWPTMRAWRSRSRRELYAIGVRFGGGTPTTTIRSFSVPLFTS
jgi:hypothetical protein